MTEAIDGRRSAWNCVWARSSIAGDRAALPQPPRVWVCERKPDERRLVTDDTCARCRFWELRDEPEKHLW